ncbi:MAG: hypothetical protein K8H88_25975, partial [Sandaracinaceae bacterium]|nr:hypothetical protein [Sandaracinaceae bacterium]
CAERVAQGSQHSSPDPPRRRDGGRQAATSERKPCSNRKLTGQTFEHLGGTAPDSATATPENMNGGPSCEATMAGTSKRLVDDRIGPPLS